MARHNSRPFLTRHLTTRTQGAFLISILLAIAALTHTALAQEPSPPVTQSVPTLKEWWRADNMGYGVDGMTWIDNFYNGKGALVVGTPKGVQTWQLRYPWDTVNIFTWTGGSGNLKTGDFNGDGVTDYIDQKGNVYKGSRNGLPELTTIRVGFPSSEGLSPFFVGDFNRDGKSDVFHFSSLNGSSYERIGIIYFGNSIMQAFEQTIIERLPPFDTGWSGFDCYIKHSGEIVLMSRIGKEKKREDGYKMYVLTAERNGTQVDARASSELIIPTEYNKIVTKGISAILERDGKQYLIAAELINGIDDYGANNLVVYNLTNDKFEKLSTTRMDGISTITALNHSIDGDSVKDWFVQRTSSATSEYFDVFSGRMDVPLEQPKRITGCQSSQLQTINNGKVFMVIGVGYYDPITRRYKGCFSINEYDTLTTVYEDDEVDAGSLRVQVIPNPASGSQIRAEIVVKQRIECGIEVYNSNGERVWQEK
ncbi:MAG: VCBS repeat-containing protein, partial [Candidatus Kapabacteria bacterium]|nr:VCBS repeat-containing protein [Candidatus Kapabacteria bacterium]